MQDPSDLVEPGRQDYAIFLFQFMEGSGPGGLGETQVRESMDKLQKELLGMVWEG